MIGPPFVRPPSKCEFPLTIEGFRRIFAIPMYAPFRFLSNALFSATALMVLLVSAGLQEEGSRTGDEKPADETQEDKGAQEDKGEGGTKYAMLGLPRELVRYIRMPGGGRHPRSMLDEAGVLHVAFFRAAGSNSKSPSASNGTKEEPDRTEIGDVFYTSSADDGATFSEPVRLNAQPAGVLVGRGGTGLSIYESGGAVHVLMMGSKHAEPRGPEGEDPLLYVRRPAGSESFEAQKNVVDSAWKRGVGVAVIADLEGNVHCFFSAENPAAEGQGIWHARSHDGGASFMPEVKITPEDRGVSMASGMDVTIGPNGRIVGSYRSRISKRRDSTMFLSRDKGDSFEVTTTAYTARKKDPASATSVTQGATKQYLLLSWEESGEVVWSFLTPLAKSVAYPMMPKVRPKRYQRSPMAMTNRSIACAITWIEKVRGEPDDTFRVAWQAWDITGRRPIGRGITKDSCGGSCPSIFVRSDDGFGILY